jgi:nucleoside-diphosphate-sugar epimerase
MPQRTALIAGATGAIGGALASHLATLPDWRVLGVCRKPPLGPIKGIEYIHTDLMNAAACRRPLPGTRISRTSSSADARRMMIGAAKASRTTSPFWATSSTPQQQLRRHLAHVNLVQGGKYYGVHVGPFPNPAREDDARTVTPNFYYDQEDLLRSRSKDQQWGWSAARPNTLLHFSPGNPRNLVSTLGAYAALCREIGIPLDFPASEGSYTSLVQVTTTTLLSRGMAWMATHEPARNNAFNLTNGDVFRWSRLWPQLADAFGIRCGTQRPVVLAEVMPEWEAAWHRVVKRYGLIDQPLAAVANWAFADATLLRWWDEILSTNKAREFGFHDWTTANAGSWRSCSNIERQRSCPKRAVRRATPRS